MGFWHEHIVLILSDLLRGEQVHRYLRLVRQAELWDKQTMQSFQEQRFRELIHYASKEVPYYREWFRTHVYTPETVLLEQLPIVNKSMMREEGIECFTAEGFPKRKRLCSRSSGSTGEPFMFFVSKEAYSVNMAAKLRTWYHSGYRLGDRYMKIAYMPRHGRMKRVQDALNNCEYVYFDSINGGNLEMISKRIEGRKPLFIRSYPMTMFLLAKYRLEHPSYTHHPLHVMTTGAVLNANERHVIEEAFGCDVIDSYNCEGNPNSAETPAHDGYHTCLYYGIVEVLDENDCPVKNGIGRVVSTDLWNLAYPFIRYDTQDLVEVRNGVIVRIIGRQSEAVTSASGTIYTIYSFMSFFEHDIEAVDAYQVVKRRDKSIRLRLVINNKYNITIEKYIVNYWHEKLGVPVDVEVVDEIPLMHNNKRLTIVDE